MAGVSGFGFRGVGFSRGADRSGKPGEVVGRACIDRQGDNFRDVVAVESLDLGAERGELVPGALNEEQIFLGRLDASLPAIDGFDRRLQNVDARGEAALNEGTRELAGFGGGAAGDEDDDMGSHSIGRATLRSFPNILAKYYSSELLPRDSLIQRIAATRYN